MKTIVIYKGVTPIIIGPTFWMPASMSAKQAEDMLSAFENSDNGILYTNMCTGWRTKLSKDECAVIVMGPGWDEASYQQAIWRVSPIKQPPEY